MEGGGAAAAGGGGAQGGFFHRPRLPYYQKTQVGIYNQKVTGIQDLQVITFQTQTDNLTFLSRLVRLLLFRPVARIEVGEVLGPQKWTLWAQKSGLFESLPL